MTLPLVRGEFRVVEDPDLRFAPSGTAVASVRLVANSRKQVDGEWVDDKVCWLRATAFNQQAENIAESVQKGDLIIAEGRLETRDYETREGEKRTAMEFIIDSVGPSLRWATARVTKTQRREGGGGGSKAPQGSGGGQPQSAPQSPPQDPWGVPQSDEPPF